MKYYRNKDLDIEHLIDKLNVLPGSGIDIERFTKDLVLVTQDCKKIHDEWHNYPEDEKQAIAYKMFNTIS